MATAATRGRVGQPIAPDNRGQPAPAFEQIPAGGGAQTLPRRALRRRRTDSQRLRHSRRRWQFRCSRDIVGSLIHQKHLQRVPIRRPGLLPKRLQNHAQIRRLQPKPQPPRTGGKCLPPRRQPLRRIPHGIHGNRDQLRGGIRE